MTYRRIIAVLLGHLVVGGAHGGYLGQMRNADNLAVGIAHLPHNVGHLLGHASAHACIYLIKDDGGQFDGSADHSLERQHDAGYLAARRYLRDGLQGGILVGTEVELQSVDTIAAQRLVCHLYLKPHVRYA